MGVYCTVPVFIWIIHIYLVYLPKQTLTKPQWVSQKSLKHGEHGISPAGAESEWD